MTREEFNQWARDMGKRLPELGTYLATLCDDTKAVWFSDIFAAFDLRDALAMNRRLI